MASMVAGFRRWEHKYWEWAAGTLTIPTAVCGSGRDRGKKHDLRGVRFSLLGLLVHVRGALFLYFHFPP